MFSSKKQHGTPVAVFDISSSSVGGAHVLVKNDAKVATERKPVILATGRIDAPLVEDLDMERFVQTTVHNIQAVASNLQKADVHSPKFIQLVLASPWYVSQTRTISYKRDIPFLCNRKLITSLVDSEIAHVIKNELERFGDFGKEGIVVEKQISLIRLNGYTTASPYGKKAKTLEIYLTITVVPKKVIDDFTDALRRTYGTREVKITTSGYATFVVARDYFNAAEECFIIDVGEEVTDVAFVKNGLFLYQHSFPVGTYGLYRQLLGKNGNAPAEAKAIIEGYRLAKISTGSKTKIDKALGGFTKEWLGGLQKIITEGYFGFCLPTLCYITADARFEGVFPMVIESDPFIQYTCSRGKVSPIFLNSEKLAPHIVSLDESLDIPLATAGLYVSRII